MCVCIVDKMNGYRITANYLGKRHVTAALYLALVHVNRETIVVYQLVTVFIIVGKANAVIVVELQGVVAHVYRARKVDAVGTGQVVYDKGEFAKLSRGIIVGALFGSYA